jgi:ribosomal protein S18 acetylase RimI-like enzyme
MAGKLIYRTAKPKDASGILAVLMAVANEIPLFVDTKDRKAAVRRIVRQCISSDESLVAVDDASKIVGFLLIEPDEMQRFQLENDALHLSYAGVNKTNRGCGVFRSLMEILIRRGMPLTATVKNANQSQMAKRLEALRFRIAETRPDEKRFVRE